MQFYEYGFIEKLRSLYIADTTMHEDKRIFMINSCNKNLEIKRSLGGTLKQRSKLDVLF
jgi:hypothetical protein